MGCTSTPPKRLSCIANPLEGGPLTSGGKPSLVATTRQSSAPWGHPLPSGNKQRQSLQRCRGVVATRSGSTSQSLLHAQACTAEPLHMSRWYATRASTRVKAGHRTTGSSRGRTRSRSNTTERCYTYTSIHRKTGQHGTAVPCDRPDFTCTERSWEGGPPTFCTEFGACGGTWPGEGKKWKRWWHGRTLPFGGGNSKSPGANESRTQRDSTPKGTSKGPLRPSQVPIGWGWHKTDTDGGS